ncbi:poly(hydroxyalkanoate) depolymerase family esterase [Paraburkholderia sp. RAU2J]|uniref:extracellular catalytic domain type 1 short-chain-length polyhydroxyalkanoate depolymerase n=1 Tax=Paraburkholderia sp. RAU2J TaxID=1938810 RepID=UPI000EB5A7B0|nr:PHB depolymerase family esterase [Paraburkholderia sp. RAU2J]RKT26523.1 poly(hydroxyalkanoate) depolymerase family esterase [Paraburkholderia sp. RAU2J]
MNMNEDFLKSMKDAFDLLRTKGPQEATAAVQRALAGANAQGRHAQTAQTQATASDWTRAWTDVQTGTHAQARPHRHARPHAPAPYTIDADTPGAFSAHTFSNSAGQRQYKLYVPAVYNQEPMPLIVMLHGCTQNADDFAAGTRMNEMAERHGFIVVYPNQSQAANHSKCWNWFKPADQQREHGEPSLIAGITREVMTRYRVDAARVYVAGLSAGGAMADIMLKTSPDLYAAACVHSGLAYGCAKDLPSALAAMKGGKPSRARMRAAPQRPLIVFHGDADTTVHPSNALELVASFEANATTVAPPPAAGASGNGRTATLQRLVAENGVEAEYWSIHGAGHAWAGGSQRGSYTDPAGPDATAEMLRFFLAHPRA